MTKDLSSIISLNPGKGAGRYYFVAGSTDHATNPDSRFNTTQIGQTRHKIEKREDAKMDFNRQSILENDFGLEFQAALRGQGVSLEDAWAFMTSTNKAPVKAKSGKSAAEKEIAELARVIVSIAPNTTPSENAATLSKLIANHQEKAIALANLWETTNSRNEDGYIRERQRKQKKA